MWTLADGKTWKGVRQFDHTPDVEYFEAVGPASTGVVAAGDAFTGTPIWSSTDGTTWRKEGSFGGAEIFVIERAGARYVAGGLGSPLGGGIQFVGPYARSAEVALVAGAYASAWYSDDGLKWSHADVDRPDNCWLDDIAAGPHGLVAVGWDQGGPAAAWTSADGTRWDRVADPDANARMHGVVAFGDGFVAVGESAHGSVWLSPVP
jgi:hypothetical protein